MPWAQRALSHPDPELAEWGSVRNVGKGTLQNPALLLGGHLGESLTSGHPSFLNYHRDNSTVKKHPEHILRAKPCDKW